MMKTVALSALSALLLVFSGAGVANSSGSVAMTFKDITWEIPSQSKAIDFDENRSEVTIFYSAGDDQYLTIQPSKRARDPKNGISCWYADLLKDVFAKNTATQCNKDSFNIFTKNFIEGSSTGSWQGNGNQAYYSESKNYTSVFVVINNHEVYRLESNFLSKDAMKAVTANVLR